MTLSIGRQLEAETRQAIQRYYYYHVHAAQNTDIKGKVRRGSAIHDIDDELEEIILKLRTR